MIAETDLYLDARGRVVEAGDPKAAFLLVRAGKAIPRGYEPPKAQVEVEPEPEKPVKRRKKPADKAVKSGGDK